MHHRRPRTLRVLSPTGWAILAAIAGVVICLALYAVVGMLDA